MIVGFPIFVLSSIIIIAIHQSFVLTLRTKLAFNLHRPSKLLSRIMATEGIDSSSSSSSSITTTTINPHPLALLVNVEIEEDRIAEFLTIMNQDALDSRTKENGGCLRFDVLKNTGSTNKFTFYEVYTNSEALNFHKTTPHFKLWSDFKSSGGVISQSAVVFDAVIFGL